MESERKRRDEIVKSFHEAHDLEHILGTIVKEEHNLIQIRTLKDSKK